MEARFSGTKASPTTRGPLDWFTRTSMRVNPSCKAPEGRLLRHLNDRLLVRRVPSIRALVDQDRRHRACMHGLLQAVYTINALGLRALSRGPWPSVSVPTCFHTSTIPYRLSLKANLMSLIDRRGTRADQTNSPQETPANSLTRESRA